MSSCWRWRGPSLALMVLALTVPPGWAQTLPLQPAEPAASAASAAASAMGPPRPKVGLVLGGGGARGAAHIGVLEVLERLQIPVACVAGTSMGALVAGAWAAGLTPQEMRKDMAEADWADMFRDDPGYEDLNFRNKRLQQRFLPGSETGITAAGAVSLPGVVSGQKIKLFFNHLVRADTGERELQQLPLPVSIIATDIGNGERVVLRDGSLTLAMRASMSVPGLLAPLEYRGRKLVDGGLVDNLPIKEVRERCGADVVIAVNVGSPPLKPEQVLGLLSITTQMVALLTEQNVSASLATLKTHDVYIQPDLAELTATSFERHAEAADRGRAAAEAVVARLAPLGVSALAYADWKRSIAVRERDVPRIDAVEIAGLKLVNPEVVRRYVQQQDSAPLDTDALNRDLLRAYGDGYYERVDYSVVSSQGRNVLRLFPVEKSWGPDYLRLAVRLDTNLSQGSTYLLRAGYQKTWLNRLGAELLLAGELGSTSGVSAELYQPLDRGQHSFISTALEYRRERVDYWFLEQRVAEYRSARTRLDVALGLNFRLLGQARLGWRETRISSGLETGVDVVGALATERAERASGGWLLALELEQADRLHFPSRGWTLKASLFDSPRLDYSRLALELGGAVPLDRYVISARTSWVASTRGRLPLSDAGRLGGLLNLTAFATGQLLGDDVAYAQLRGERIIGRAPLGLRGELRAGIALEAGRVGVPYTRQVREGTLHSLAFYLAGETPVGPFFLGVGRGSAGSVNAYLVIGAP